MAYSKLHSSIVNSSLWTEPDSVRILFVTLLAICDRDGVVYGSKPGIDRIANIDPDDSEEAWTCLLSPDKNSSDKIRAPQHEGRRIEEVSGGFRLLNFEYYRGLRNDDDRREQNRTAQARFKAKVSQGKPQSSSVSRGNPMQRQKQRQIQKQGGEAIPPSNGNLGTAERISLDQSVKRINVRLEELKDADLPKYVEERRELKAEKARCLGILGLKA